MSEWVSKRCVCEWRRRDVRKSVEKWRLRCRVHHRQTYCSDSSGAISSSSSDSKRKVHVHVHVVYQNTASKQPTRLPGCIRFTLTEISLTARRYAIAVFVVIECLFFRPSVCHKSKLYQTDKRRITQATPHKRPGTLVLWRDLYGTPMGGPPMGGGRQIQPG